MFFDDDTMNEQNFHSMLKELFVPELKRLCKASSAIFQRNGVPAHLSRDVRQYLDKVLPNRWIGRGDLIRSASYVLRSTFFYGDMLKTIFTSHQFAISIDRKLT